MRKEEENKRGRVPQSTKNATEEDTIKSQNENGKERILLDPHYTQRTDSRRGQDTPSTRRQGSSSDVLSSGGVVGQETRT